MPERPDSDPFEGLILDEAFIKAARKREPSGEDRMARAAALRDKLDAEAAAELRANRWYRRAARRLRRLIPSRRTVVAAALIAAVIGLAWWNRDGGAAWVGGDPITGMAGAGLRPTPAPADSERPLGEPIDPPAGSGSYRFLSTQPGSAAPVAYDPCRPIAVVVNERTMPAGADDLVAEAVDEISTITGLQFSIEGTTDEVPGEGRAAFQPERYGDRWAPVLIAWSDPEEHPGLAGSVAGLGGSQRIEVSPKRVVYVTGDVTLDGPAISQIMRSANGRGKAKAVVLHELGHLLGLNHVADPAELMHPTGSDLDVFGEGDLTGLAQLGRGACVPEL